MSPLGLVLFVAHFLHPVDGLAVQRLLNGDVGHRRSRRCAMPVLLTGLEPDYIPWTDLFDRPALALHPAAPEDDDQRLTQWMRVPCRARAGLEGDGVAGRSRRGARSEQ